MFLLPLVTLEYLLIFEIHLKFFQKQYNSLKKSLKCLNSFNIQKVQKNEKGGGGGKGGRVKRISPSHLRPWYWLLWLLNISFSQIWFKRYSQNISEFDNDPLHKICETTDFNWRIFSCVRTDRFCQIDSVKFEFAFEILSCPLCNQLQHLLPTSMYT